MLEISTLDYVPQICCIAFKQDAFGATVKPVLEVEVQYFQVRQLAGQAVDH